MAACEVSVGGTEMAVMVFIYIPPVNEDILHQPSKYYCLGKVSSTSLVYAVNIDHIFRRDKYLNNYKFIRCNSP